MKTKATKTSELIEVEDHFANRPQTKPSERISGRLLKWKDSDYVAFEPQKPRDTPARTILKEGKGCQYYHNEGEKDNSYSLHVNVDGSEKDPAGALLEKASAVLRQYLKEEPKIDTRNFIEDSPELQVWHRKGKHQLCAFITIDSHLPREQMSGRLFRLCSEINKIIDSKKF